ncbi:MAG TPA: class I SAM-dependent methyltransferase [Candidatus Hydrogenedentes bacterium]|nr:class I SAM-dependent methyltransferase [Candidatus Hydrogenedentota bacterium]
MGQERCIACEGELALFGDRDGYAYHRCERCASLQLVPLPTEQFLEQAYAEKYASSGHIPSNAAYSRKVYFNHYQAVIAAIKTHCRQGLVLEAGPGWGGVGEELLASGYTYQAVEPSNDMADYCRRQGLEVIGPSLFTVKGRSYDVIVLSSVFEHLVNHHDWLEHARELLKPGGLVVSTQPTAPFAELMGQCFRLGNMTKPLPQLHQVFCPPWHVALFSLEGMRKLAASHGFQCLEIRPMPQAREAGVNGWMQRILERVNRLGWAVAGEHWPLVIGHIFVLRKE